MTTVAEHIVLHTHDHRAPIIISHKTDSYHKKNKLSEIISNSLLILPSLKLKLTILARVIVSSSCVESREARCTILVHPQKNDEYNVDDNCNN